jgi:uncharacterized Zn-binding protein involved in type VI secretion
MTEQPVARVGDTSSHGGVILGPCSSTFFIDGGKAVARSGDMHQCPITGHGTTALSGSSSIQADGGRVVVRIGDTAGCGAVINSGSPTLVSGP